MFAHLLVTGGMRRVHLRGLENIQKRMLVHGGACNLGLLMRTLFRVGTPRGLQGLAGMQAALAQRSVTVILLSSWVPTRSCRHLCGILDRTLFSSSGNSPAATPRRSVRAPVTMYAPRLRAISATDC